MVPFGPGTGMELCSSNGRAEEWKDGRLEAWEIFLHAILNILNERLEKLDGRGNLFATHPNKSRVVC